MIGSCLPVHLCCIGQLQWQRHGNNRRHSKHACKTTILRQSERCLLLERAVAVSSARADGGSRQFKARYGL